MNFKQKAIAALEELKGDRTGIIAATIEDCQKVIGGIPEDDWIPVTERLPQEELPLGALVETVQVLLMNGSVTVGFCNRGMKVWYYLPVREVEFVGHGYGLTPVIAWKPLPEPPKEVPRAKKKTG